MTAKQEAKLNMFRATQKHCNDNPAIVASVPAFDNATKALNTKIAAIIATAQQEDLITKGITVDKAEAKKILCQLTIDTAAPISAYAAANGNNKLMKEVDFTYTELFRTKDDQLAPRCKNIHDAANTNLAALTAYGITTTTISTLLTSINNYQSKVPDPRNAAAQKATVRANLKNLIKEAENVLKLQMDKTIVGFKATHPDFVTTYKTNRIILDPSKTTTTLKGVITNSADNTFITSATILLDPSGVTSNTNKLGEYEIKPIAAATYTIVVSAPKYKQIKENDIIVKQGQINKQDFTLTLE